MDPRAERTRATVLQAARGVLIDEGLTAVTHSRVAEASGVARRTLYRHWPTSAQLLHDVMATASYPTYALTGDLATDVEQHLRQLREALDTGPLAYILLALGERAASDPAMHELRAALVADGCRPLRELLRAHGVPEAQLDDAVDELEGPLLSSALLHGRPVGESVLQRMVTRAVELAEPGAARTP